MFRAACYYLKTRSEAALTALLLLALLCGAFAPVAMAQEGEQMVINQIDGRGWPSVSLNLKLTGPDGKAVPDLDVSQFEISEEGVVQSLGGMTLGAARSVPVWVVLAIDISGSMAGDKLAQAKAAAISFVAPLTPTDSTTVLSFNTQVRVVVPATNDHAALEAGINSLQAGRDTAAFDALYAAADLANKAPQGMRRAIVLLTDGADTASRYSPRVASDVARQAGALVYTIGLGPDANDAVLKDLAEPGGRYYKAPAPSDLQGIYNAISLELSSQLLLKYTSTTRVDREYKLVQVQVKYTSKSGQVIVQTVRYRPPPAALLPSTPEAPRVYPTRGVVRVPDGMGTGDSSSGQDAISGSLVSSTASLLGIFAAVLAGLAVLMFVAALAVRAMPSPAVQRLDSYTSEDRLTPAPVSPKAPNFVSRVLAPLVEWLGRRMVRLTPKGYTTNVRQLLLLAGPPYRLQLGTFLGIQLGLAILLMVPILWWMVRTYPTMPAQWVLGAALALVMGIYFPYYWLARRVDRRKAALLKALPSALDFLSINVEAGMGFDSALSEVVRRWKNPLTDEFALLLIDFQIGKPRKDAWRDLIQRTQLPDLSSFITAMVQNEQVGSSIGGLLRVQAEHMRVRRRQRAEELARVAPVKMLLPLVFFIFPGILVVLLGPAIPQILDVFGNRGP